MNQCFLARDEYIIRKLEPSILQDVNITTRAARGHQAETGRVLDSLWSQNEMTFEAVPKILEWNQEWKIHDY